MREEGEYQVLLSSDDGRFGGQNRISTTQVYRAVRQGDGRIGFQIYLPSHTALVLQKKPARRKKSKA